MELFTDELMFILSAGMLVAMGWFFILFWRAVGLRTIWPWLTVTYLAPQAMIAVYYYGLWQSPDTPLALVGYEQLGMFFRPGLFGVYVFILVNKLIIYRLITLLNPHGAE